MLKLSSFEPSPYISSVVKRYIYVEADMQPGFEWNHMIIPTPMEWLFFNLESTPAEFTVVGEKVSIVDCSVTGTYPTSFYANLRGKVKLLGAQVNTPGIYSMFGIPVSEYPLHLLPFEDVLARDVRPFCQQLRELNSVAEVIGKLNAFFAYMISRSRDPNQNLLHSLSLIQGSKGKISVRDLTKATRVSERALQKTFLKGTGLTPKEYIRIRRFNSAAQYMMTTGAYSWTDIVEKLGYYDQAHFINDFKSICGVSPSIYFAGIPEAHRFLSDL